MIELWWWVKPLFYTGFITLMVIGVPACWMDHVGYYRISFVMAIVAVAPYVVTILSVLVWLLSNVMILIWR